MVFWKYKSRMVMKTIKIDKTTYYIHFESLDYYLVSVKKDSSKFKIDKK